MISYHMHTFAAKPHGRFLHSRYCCLIPIAQEANLSDLRVGQEVTCEIAGWHSGRYQLSKAGSGFQGGYVDLYTPPRLLGYLTLWMKN